MKAPLGDLPRGDLSDDELVRLSNIIQSTEYTIDHDKDIYMITWVPHEDHMPDVSFTIQHEIMVDTLISYLRYCATGIFCLESTQRGFPHYHGWYQVDEQLEFHRIIMVKVMERFGLVKITKVKNCYRLFSFTEQGNALYYYKKDLFGSMGRVPHNPITKYDQLVNVDMKQYAWCYPGRTVADRIDACTKFTSARQFYSEKF